VYWICRGDLEHRWALAMCEEAERERELELDLARELELDPFEETEVELVPVELLL
jgi:hypothetical protein